MNIYDYMSAHPVVTVILAIIALTSVQSTFAYLINRPLRHANIRKHGWPPAHCDADGDFKSDDE